MPGEPLIFVEVALVKGLSGSVQALLDEKAPVQDPAGLMKYMLYDDAGNKVADIDGNGTLTEYVYDGANNVVRTITYGAAVPTTGLLDAAGQPTAITLASLRPQQAASGMAALLHEHPAPPRGSVFSIKV